MVEPGQTVSHYRILECLGSGGMGVVYSAQDLKLDRPVALKFLSPSLAHRQLERRRLNAEARTASKLNHPGICVIYDVEELETSESFIAMELIAGTTLSRRIKLGPMSIPEISSIAMQVARAVEFAHLEGILHRDIKSANIMIDSRGRARVMDFGLAMMRAPSESHDTTGAMGTLAYMAPELIQGRAADERSDMYSFGVVLYEMLAGRVPFAGTDSASVAFSILSKEPDPVEGVRRDVPHHLAAIVERLLKKEPYERYVSMGEVISELSQESSADGISREHSATARSPLHTHNFPAYTTRFLGRQKHLGRLKELLRTAHLLTLTGPGGTGKTRLAVQLAREAATSFPDGAHFIPLAPISDQGLVPSAIAQVLGVRESEGRTLHETLLRHVRHRTILLVLDNFEHILGASRLVHEIITAGPSVSVVVTSRSPLRMAGEVEYPVPPMELPDPKKNLSLGMVARSEAASLFAQVAIAARPGFALTSENAAVVAAICARVDGLPLAIELAAARTGLLSPQAILSRLEHRMKLLKAGSSTPSDRQQTLRASIAWSFDLLDPPEKKLFSRLSVFVGGFSLRDAEAIANLPGDLQTEVIDGVESLATKSLIRRIDTTGDEPRFLMLETIREFGLECLESMGELQELRLAHARRFLTLVQESEDPVFERWDTAWVERLRGETGNIRAALETCKSTADIDLLIELVGSLWYFWNYSHLITEGLAWADHALSASMHLAPSRARARALHTAGYLALLAGDFATARTHLRSSLDTLQAASDDRTTAEVLNTLSLLHMFVHDHENARRYQAGATAIFRSLGLRARVADCLANDIEQENDDEARRLYLESLETFRELGNKRGIARLLRNLGFLSYRAGDHVTFKHMLLEALPLHREVGDLHLLSHHCNYLGDASRCDRDYVEAGQWYTESRLCSSESGFKGEYAWAVTGLGFVALDRGDVSHAGQLFIHALKIRVKEDNRRGIAACLLGLSSAARMRGETERAIRLLGAVDAALIADPGLFLPADRYEFERSLAAARDVSDAASFDRLMDDGHRLTLAQAVRLLPEKDLYDIPRTGDSKAI